MLRTARAKAARAGVPFGLSLEDIHIPDRCPVFPEIRLSRSTGGAHYASPSLDRLIPQLGYVPGNVAVISLFANRLKSNASPAELRRLADWMDDRLRDLWSPQPRGDQK